MLLGHNVFSLFDELNEVGSLLFWGSQRHPKNGRKFYPQQHCDVVTDTKTQQAFTAKTTRQKQHNFLIELTRFLCFFVNYFL
jgi:hypothetical protein